jgi:GAF domain-containing protein
MEVRDALKDERFADNPLVVGPPNIRYYAGAPLKHSSGHMLGTLCLIDSQPKHLAPEELEHLAVLAHVVTMELEHQDKMDNCKDHCIYGRLAIECPFRDEKHKLPE